MKKALDEHDPDGKRRALVGSEKWSHTKLRAITKGLRFHYHAHRIPGVRLSLASCAENGLVFAWHPVSDEAE